MPIVLTGDVQGRHAITAASRKVGQRRGHGAGDHRAGGITESDVTLAHASQAVILVFNVRA